MELINHPELQNAFLYNECSQLVDNRVFRRRTDTPAGTNMKTEEIRTRSKDLQKFNYLHWDGSKSLPDFIDTRWHRQTFGGYEWQFIAKRPKFLQVQYTLNKPSERSISELRVLKFSTPEAWKKDGVWRFERNHAEYNLLAVVRLAESNYKDSIRTYWKDGKELVPDNNVKHFEDKDPDAVLERQWSVQDKGRYMLYYYRLIQPEGWPESEMDIHQPEFEPRAWVERKRAIESDEGDKLAFPQPDIQPPLAVSSFLSKTEMLQNDKEEMKEEEEKEKEVVGEGAVGVGSRSGISQT